MVCKICKKEKCNKTGYVKDDDGTKWIAMMCGESIHQYLSRWEKNFGLVEKEREWPRYE
jgi:hypothetical protein